MPFPTTCPNCDARLQVPDTLAGKRVKCKKCDEAFVARPPAEDDADEAPARPAKAPPKLPPPKSRPADDDEPRRLAKTSRPTDDDEGPRARRSRDDDEDRPRRKAGGKAKKGKKKSSLVTVLMLGIAGFVALGVGLPLALWYAYGREPDLGTTELQNTRPGGPGKAAGGGPPAGNAGAAAWIEHVDAEGKFRLKFPRAPVTQTRTVQTPAGPVEVKAVQALVPPEVFVASAVVNPDPNVDPQALLNAAVEQVPAQVQGGAVTSQKPITYRDQPGREITLTVPGGLKSVVRVVVANGRIYTVGVVGPDVQATTPNVVTFFESLIFD